MRALSVATIAVVLSNGPAVAEELFDSDEFCRQITLLQGQSQPDVGQMLDDITRNNGIAVLCGLKVVELKKFLVVSSSDLRDGWQERKARQWDQIYCADGPFREAIANGWTIAMQTTTEDGARFWHKAGC